ncbi:hypothetical protein K227x_43360 [Rubripirellula lacrimiformis]|uniref:Uncharacterized protein n=1 Tax=Rubripirellula lacrimiformis TaxID=1930273 RepID=A0A517NFL9_9BACT|nr:hypothetical protein K227x_43360 [Rubripirellula lacrimiformis]
MESSRRARRLTDLHCSLCNLQSFRCSALNANLAWGTAWGLAFDCRIRVASLLDPAYFTGDL